jgi:hypothetical protein
MAATPAGAAVHAPAAWHVAKTVPGPNFPAFTAAADASATSAWAFEASQSGAKTRAYQLSGRTWRLRPFPAKQGEQIFSASATSSSDVWVFSSTSSSTSRVLRFNGQSWRQVKTFGKLINSGLAISSTDVWVFGESFAPSLGAVHYNGHTWTQTARGLLGGSALSARSVWAYGTSSVAHWNGTRWRVTSVAKLLPKGGGACGPGFLGGIDAISASNVVAVGAGGCPDGQGPFVLLHYNGTKWSRVAIRRIHADPFGVIGDGAGGVWIPLGTGAPVSSFIDHYSHGTLAQVKLPISEQHLALFGASIGPHTTAALAFGLSRKSFSASTSTAVILRFGR